MVSIKNLSFAFKRDQPLFSNLSLELESGRIYGLFGLNGAGKTTLLHQISGMLFPCSGTCNALDSESRDRKPKTLSEIFLVPEQFSLPALKGVDYIKIHAPFYPKFDYELMDRISEEFELNNDRKIPEMSYGQRKKFLIAFGLATQANILLLDEPTNGLDIPSKSQFRKTIASIDNSGRCIVISTHQVRDLGAMIDHIVVLKDGSIVFDQSLSNVSKALRFGKAESAGVNGYIYGEEALAGMNAILSAKKSAGDSEIDLELLFNGVIRETEKINAEF